jgi:pre-rRNA-processing protein TSR4
VTDAVAPKPFGLGSQVFGNPKPSENTPDFKNDSSGDSLATAIASVSLDESSWLKAPAYPPVYLSTISEYIPPPPKLRLPAGVRMHDSDSDTNKDLDWIGSEVYENSLGIDRVFERFTKRVAYEGLQCVR